MFISEKYQRLFLFLITILCYLPFLGAMHLFDWDEINFAECAREMIVGNDYMHVKMGFQAFYEKPPLFIWMQVLCMKAFGINELAARLPNALCGILTIQWVYTLGKKIHQARFAWWWALAYLCSILPHVYFKSGIIDPWFNLFIFSSLYFLYNFYTSQKVAKLWIGGLLLGLALLTKGPVAALIVGLTLVVIIAVHNVRTYKEHRTISLKWPIALRHLIVYFLISTMPIAIWYLIDIIQHGPQLVIDFLNYQLRLLKTEDAGHGGFPGYHIVVLLFGCFPASVFAIHHLIGKQSNHVFTGWMKTLFWVVLILFSLVQSKIVHYSSLCYFPLTYCAAMGILDIQDRKRVLSKIQIAILSFSFVLFSLLTLGFPFVVQQISWLQELMSKDPFAAANLNAQVHWTGLEIVPGICLLLGFGWAVYFFRKTYITSAVTVVFLTSLTFIQGILFFYVKNIEGYSQRAAIDFFKTLKGKDVYVNTYNYKSYAPYFYAEITPFRLPLNKSSVNDYYLFDSIDKPVYLSSKITSMHDENLSKFTLLYEKNGFAFFMRKP